MREPTMGGSSPQNLHYEANPSYQFRTFRVPHLLQNPRPDSTEFGSVLPRLHAGPSANLERRVPWA